MHFIIALLVMILVAGLRYRVGGDTLTFTNEFKEYPKLSHLNLETFSQFRYAPLWIILNSLGRSLGDFVFVQLIAATLHIGIWGYIAKQVCPSFLFSQLLIYYIFDFLMFNTEVMREGVAISFFLLAILALNRRQFIKMWLYAVIAFFFHQYAILVFLLFYAFYLFIGDKQILGVLSMFFLIILFYFINKDYIAEYILRLVGDSHSSNTLLLGIRDYSYNSYYTTSLWNWKGILFCLGRPLFMGILIMYTKSIYNQLIRLDWRIFASSVWLSILLTVCSYSMPIVSRFYNYFHFFTSILLILFIIKTAQRIVTQQRVLLYMSFILIFTMWEVREYMRPLSWEPSECWYVRYYPYSSVFDQTLDWHREFARRQEFLE